jgi:hypothetical protein
VIGLGRIDECQPALDGEQGHTKVALQQIQQSFEVDSVDRSELAQDERVRFANLAFLPSPQRGTVERHGSRRALEQLGAHEASDRRRTELLESLLPAAPLPEVPQNAAEGLECKVLGPGHVAVEVRGYRKHCEISPDDANL